MGRTNCQPQVVTQAARGTYYCYDKQAWIVSGVVQDCGHPQSMRPGCCYGGDHAGEYHGACEQCR